MLKKKHECLIKAQADCQNARKTYSYSNAHIEGKIFNITENCIYKYHQAIIIARRSGLNNCNESDKKSFETFLEATNKVIKNYVTLRENEEKKFKDDDKETMSHFTKITRELNQSAKSNSKDGSYIELGDGSKNNDIFGPNTEHLEENND